MNPLHLTSRENIPVDSKCNSIQKRDKEHNPIQKFTEKSSNMGKKNKPDIPLNGGWNVSMYLVTGRDSTCEIHTKFTSYVCNSSQIQCTDV